MRITPLLQKEKNEAIYEKKMQYCEKIAEFLLYNGVMGDNMKNCNPYLFEDVGEKFAEPRSLIYYSKNHKVTLRNAKWYLKNKYECKDPIWNGSFLMGMSKCGSIRWGKVFCSSCFHWSVPKYLYEMLQTKCPYKGQFRYHKREFFWSNTSCFFLPCNKDTYSYLAGVMMGAVPIEIDGITYGAINNKSKQEMEKYGIPIESKFNKAYFLISPIWPVLFLNFMPEDMKNMWQDIKNPYLGEEYATLLWIKFVGNLYFERNALPFLKSRRKHFYKYSKLKGDMDTKSYLEREVVKQDLVSLDGLFKDLVRERIYNERIDFRYQHLKNLENS